MKQLNWYQIFGNTHTIPDGRTVTPTDDIQIWLNCADIWDKTYTTLAEVLADTDTLLALISSNNAVDYMVRSTTWAVAQALVPTMTDNTHPSGVCFAKSAYGSMQPYMAFDGNDSTAIHTANYTVVEDWWVGYQFATNTAIAKATYLLGQSQSQAITPSVKLQASADGITYEDVSGVSTVTIPSGGTKVSGSAKCTSISDKLYYRIFTNGKGVSVFSLQFYSVAITTDSTAMTAVGNNNYCANTLLADATWCEAIANSEYIESVLNVKVPTMTSNTAPSGVCSASSQNDSVQAPYKAFDKLTNTGWLSSYTVAGQWITYQFPTSRKIYAVYAMNSTNAAFCVRTAKYLVSSDGNTYTEVCPFDSDGTASKTYVKVLPEPVEAQYHRIRVQTAYEPAGRCGYNELNFYGREDV